MQNPKQTRKSQRGPHEAWVHHHQKHTMSRSYHQGQRSWHHGQSSQDQNFIPMHNYPSWVVHRHKLASGNNTLDVGVSTRIPRSRSWLQSQMSQNQKFMPMHIHPSWVVAQNKLAILASIPWAQKRPKQSQVQGHCSRVKGHRTKTPCPCTSTPHG